MLLENNLFRISHDFWCLNPKGICVGPVPSPQRREVFTWRGERKDRGMCGLGIMFHTPLQEGISSSVSTEPSLCLFKPICTLRSDSCLAQGLPCRPTRSQSSLTAPCTVSPDAITWVYKPHWKAGFSWELINKPQSHDVCKTLKNGIIIYWELWALQKAAHCIFRKRFLFKKKIIMNHHQKTPTKWSLYGKSNLAWDSTAGLFAALILLCSFYVRGTICRKTRYSFEEFPSHASFPSAVIILGLWPLR